MEGWIGPRTIDDGRWTVDTMQDRGCKIEDGTDGGPDRGLETGDRLVRSV
jgi:hypothetical protein